MRAVGNGFAGVGGFGKGNAGSERVEGTSIPMT
jgi:hypothetical protein